MQFHIYGLEYQFKLNWLLLQCAPLIWRLYKISWNGDIYPV